MAGLRVVLQVDLALARVPTQVKCLEVQCLLVLVLCPQAQVRCRLAHPLQEDVLLRQALCRHLDDSLRVKALLLLEHSVLPPQALGHRLQGSDLAQDQCRVLACLLICKFTPDRLCLKGPLLLVGLRKDHLLVRDQ